jgi:hypothetical protein
MIYIGLKKFRKALELLHNVILPPILVSSVASCLPIYRLPIYIFISVFQAVTAPMTSLNAITIEAYKKYVLVSLIQNGQVFHLHPTLLNDATFREKLSYGIGFRSIISPFRQNNKCNLRPH